MIGLIIDYALAIFDLIILYLTDVLNLLITLGWIIAIKKFHLQYKLSLKVCLGLLFSSMFLTFFNLDEVAGIVAEYAFIFLLIGVVQWIFSKNTS